MKKSKYLRGEGLALLIALVVGFVVFYVFLPPISLQSREFYFFAILLMGVWFLARIPIVSSYVEEKGMQGRKKKLYSFSRCSSPHCWPCCWCCSACSL